MHELYTQLAIRRSAGLSAPAEDVQQLFRRQGFEYDHVFDWTIGDFLGREPDAQEPFMSIEVHERLGADTTQPSADVIQDVT